VHKIPPRLQALYDAATDAARLLGSSAEGVFDPCGLLLEMPPATEYYWCTPKGVRTFARTGGDGVHYSYFDVPSPSGLITPVVMTVPMSDDRNHVIAESFDEFFGLGYHVGWFALEQAPHDPAWSEAHFSAEDLEASDDKVVALALLRERLAIRYVPLRAERLTQLTKKYSQFVVTPPLPDEA
jgi:hypothetical protein